MTELVLDTNVLVMVDIQAHEMDSEEQRACATVCYDWLEQFRNGNERLIIDSYSTYAILTEYRNRVRPGGVAESLLNLLTGELFYRLELKNIQLDANGIALVPERFQFVHSKDRKFIAVAIQCKPYAPIYNATDTDWTKEREQLEAAGIFVEELCPDYISAARGGG